MTTGARAFPIPLPRSRPGRPRPRTVVALLALLLVIGAGWQWLRSSSLVAVQTVVVSGLRGADTARIEHALVARARTMTTLDADVGGLREAVAPYPVVKGLTIRTHFPHGIDIHVIEQVAVGAVSVGGRTLPVAADGTILRDAGSGNGSLPLITLAVPPGGGRLTDAAGQAELRVLAAAPYQMLGRLSAVRPEGGAGLAVQVRGGPSIVFGDGTGLAAKWAAATAVLAAPSSAGAAYIDVSDPARPAAGAGTAVAGGGGGMAAPGTATKG